MRYTNPRLLYLLFNSFASEQIFVTAYSVLNWILMQASYDGFGLSFQICTFLFIFRLHADFSLSSPVRT